MGFCSTLLLLILAFLLPPVPVIIITGCGKTTLLNIVLTILGYVHDLHGGGETTKITYTTPAYFFNFFYYFF